MSQRSLLLAVFLSHFYTLSLAFQILDPQIIGGTFRSWRSSTNIHSRCSIDSRSNSIQGVRPFSSLIQVQKEDPFLSSSFYQTALLAAEQSFSDSSSRDTNNQAIFDNRTSSTSTGSNSTKRTPPQQLELPWGQRQKWALKDNVSKYTVDIPQLKQSITGPSDSLTSSYVMWRAMTRDIIELAGYNVEFLQSKYLETMNESDKDEIHSIVPGVLPLIDKFEFQSNGGISGRIEGLAGIADGTTIQTSPLVHVQLTIPRGYVLTEDGSAAYELGMPLSEEKYSFDLANMLKVDASTNRANIVWQDTVQSGVKETGKVALNLAGSVSDKETRDMLTNLGATTAILLGGATAVNMLSHHLTVNVFWV